MGDKLEADGEDEESVVTHPGGTLSDAEAGGFGVPGSTWGLCSLGCAQGGALLDAGAALPSVTAAGKAAVMGTLLQTHVLWGQSCGQAPGEAR